MAEGIDGETRRSSSYARVRWDRGKLVVGAADLDTLLQETGDTQAHGESPYDGYAIWPRTRGLRRRQSPRGL